MFIIHKHGNKTSIQPILKSNSTSFMSNKKFCEMKGRKFIQQGGAWGNGGTVQIASWKCNFCIYLDMQVYYLDILVITTLLCVLLVLYVLDPSIYSIFYLTTALLKSDVFRTHRPTRPTVFNLQASQQVHCEEKAGSYYQLSRITSKLVVFFF